MYLKVQIMQIAVQIHCTFSVNRIIEVTQIIFSVYLVIKMQDYQLSIQYQVAAVLWD